MKVMDISPIVDLRRFMRGWRNWLARVPYKHEAMGSSPLLRTSEVLLQNKLTIQVIVESCGVMALTGKAD